MCGGDFMSKNPEEAMDFLSYVAEVSRGWDEPHKGEVGKMKSQPNALHAKILFASSPCIPDLLMAKDFKDLVLHVSELPIALPKIPHNSPQSRIALVIKKAIKTPKLNTI
ncbi:hypothetical protein VitviT2T_013918 [Vitis vinifera]|uniref:Uncharacterized protein n=1 Tax=Vitis vinifera TaxID=29760 RepID=A0ABY9CI58_VITVI|nr:hypothetical protein VitviT2T_013918 [Vitis vinifera]